MEETRYAIIIGINDYNNAPLEYCVNDANEVKTRLLEKARFKDQNIFLLTSDATHPIKDISGSFNNAFVKISENFKEELDSIFFYFAGHGYADGGSFILFQDTPLNIRDIFDRFASIKPKYQFFMFDSCYSGGKTLTRKIPQKEKERIEFSSGVTLLYACTDSQIASECMSLQHGVLTDAFLKVMDDRSFYGISDGTITPSRISEEVSKIVSEYTSWVQTPVCESRVIGSYPFGFLTTDQGDDSIAQIPDGDNIEAEERAQSPEDIISTIQETRMELFLAVKGKIDTETEKLTKYFNNSYSIEIFDEIPASSIFSNPDTIIQHLVEQSKKFFPLKKCIGIQSKEVRKSYKWFNASMILDSVYGDPKGNYETVHFPGINYFSDIVYNKTCIFNTQSILNPTFCAGLIGAQVKWGIIIIFYLFEMDWDGEKDSVIRDISSKLERYSLEHSSIIKIQTSNFFNLEEIANLIHGWEQKRKDELESFKKGVK